MDLQLVLLDFSLPSQSQVDELAIAAGGESVEEARSVKSTPQICVIIYHLIFTTACRCQTSTLQLWYESK